MKYKVVLITDKLRSIGYQLASIDGVYEADDKEMTTDLVNQLSNDDEIGIILITNNLLPDDRQFDRKMQQTFPFIVPIPVFEPVTGKLETLDLEELIQRSIGIFVKL